MQYCCCHGCWVPELCPTLCDLWTVAWQTSPVFTISQNLLKLMSIELMMPSNYLILCHPLLLLPSIFPSIRVFSNELSLCIRWLKYWSFSNSSSNEYSWLIFFRIDWFDLLTVQGTLKCLLWNYSLKASIFQSSALFKVQLSHPYMSSGKTIALTIWTFVSKANSLVFNMLSRLVIAFLLRSKWLFMAAVTICTDFGAQENEIWHCFYFFTFCLP